MEAPERPPEAEGPLTREDVRRRIEEHGGPEGLDLSGKTFRALIDLSTMDLHGIILRNAILRGAILRKANLQNADLWQVDLQPAKLIGRAESVPATLLGADLRGATFEGAQLPRANLQHANLQQALLLDTDLQRVRLESANIEGARLFRTRLWGASLAGTLGLDAVDLSNVVWKGVKRGQDGMLAQELRESFPHAAAEYRILQGFLKRAELRDDAALFYYREMECRRKALSWRKEPLQKLWYTLLWGAAGYGERPERVAFSWGLPLLLGLAVIYWGFSAITCSQWWECMLRSLHFSAVSFTAVGYGSWWKESSVQGWAQGLGAFEAFIGVFTIALFLTTFVRKMTR